MPSRIGRDSAKLSVSGPRYMAIEMASNRRARVELQTKVATLKQAKTYPDKPGRVDVVETHMSWVFFTDRYAYKLKKPVRYDFLDFSTLEARERYCTEEVRLNRRLAHGVYLAVIPLTIDSQGNVGFGEGGEVIDWLVKMRRLPANRMLDHMIAHQNVQTADIREAALLLARFYKASPPVRLHSEQYRAQFEHDVKYNRRGLKKSAYGLDGDLIDRIHDAQLGTLEHDRMLFDPRLDKIVEGHGDLRPEHICLQPTPVIFDCIEFNRRFKIVDPADELSFLAMECERLGAPFVGREFFRIYQEVTDDSPPECVVQFYKAYRACLRARLAIWHTHELEQSQWPKWRKLANEYLALANVYIQRFS